MCSAAAVIVTIPLIRKYEYSQNTKSSDAGVYTDQIKEIERDRSLGLIANAEADLARVEIERRLIATVKAQEVPRPVSLAWRNGALAATAGWVALGAVYLYALKGRPDLPAAAAGRLVPNESSNLGAATQATESTSSAPASAAAGDVDAMINKLASKLKQTPGDADGWRMLGWSYFNTRRYEESAAAYAKAYQLAPDNVDYGSAYAEALVQAAGGIVTPKAQGLIVEVLKQDPKEARGRFYAALAREQAGDFSAALDQWITLLADAPKDAGWTADVRQRIADLGQKTGRDTSAILANAPEIQSDGGTGLPATGQNSVVDGMIAKLMAKLEDNPRDRDGWAMMMRSLKVKGDMTGASAALGKALAAFKDDASTRARLAGLAQSLGISGGEAGMAAEASSIPVISQENAASITSLPLDDQQAAIQGMVDRLAEKLSKSPHDAGGWVRLIRSRIVLNQPDLAKQALRTAVTEFSSDPAQSGEIIASARQLGITLE